MRRWLCAGVGLLLSGCLAGRIYTHTTVPLTTDFHATPVVEGDGARGSVKSFRYSWVDVRWDENAIGRVAKDNGLARIYYADLEVLSILGIWTQSYVRVYGEPTAEDAPQRPQEP